MSMVLFSSWKAPCSLSETTSSVLVCPVKPSLGQQTSLFESPEGHTSEFSFALPVTMIADCSS